MSRTPQVIDDCLQDLFLLGRQIVGFIFRVSHQHQALTCCGAAVVDYPGLAAIASSTGLKEDLAQSTGSGDDIAGPRRDQKVLLQLPIDLFTYQLS